MDTKVFKQDRVYGFVHAQGRIMVNGRGEEIIFRGLGAANWNNPEGFMIGAFSDFQVPDQKKNTRIGRMDRGRSFSALIRELCGTKYEESFWPRWYRHHLAEADIKQMSDWGFNSVRLPLDARTLLFEEPGITFNEDTFVMLDQVIDWCRKYHLYAILDLHAAVGGQSALPCDDGVDGMPHLFYDEESWERTMILCEELAKRYGGNPAVGAFDLINEPLSGPLWEEYIPKLQQFYKELVARMRQYDKNHLILLNGHIFSSRVDMFTQNYDPECNNWGLAIHNYGAMPDMAVYGSALERSQALDIPVWFGEGGGSPAWMSVMYQLAVDNHIGFNIWCYKAAGEKGKGAGFVGHKLPKEWQMIIDYAKDGGVRPSYAHAQEIFDEYLELIKYEHCWLDDEKVPYVMRIPGCVIPGAGYDARDFEGHYEGGNPFNCRLSDHLQIIAEEGYVSKLGVIGMQDVAGDWEHYVLKLSAGEFVTYTLREFGKGHTVNVQCGRMEDAVVKAEFICDKECLAEYEFSGSGESYTAKLTPAWGTVQETIALRLKVVQGSCVVKQIDYK